MDKNETLDYRDEQKKILSSRLKVDRPVALPKHKQLYFQKLCDLQQSGNRYYSLFLDRIRKVLIEENNHL